MAKIDPTHLPRHIGIIMDGNGRWAQAKKLPRSAGHKEGLQSAKAVLNRAAEAGIKYVTLYTFSTENWKRAQEEVSFLFNLVTVYLRKEMDFYRNNNIKVVHSGDPHNIPAGVWKEFVAVCKDTADADGLTLNLAFNYGGRDEIVRAVNRYLDNCRKKKTEPGEITEKIIQQHLDHPEIPDADLIIRTAGEQRLSNFLLWSSAYAEFHFSDKFWPDWNGDDLDRAILDYQSRTRRYGGVL